MILARVGRSFLRGAGITGLALLVGSPPAWGCSICRCGDVTFNALGKVGYTMPGFRSALDWEQFDKDEGDPAVETESQTEHRWTALFSYSMNERFMMSVRLPYSVRDLTSTASGEEPEEIHTSGLSDPEIYGQVLLWASSFSSEVGRRESLSLGLGVKTPWGANDETQAGERLDEHAQPGTGSTDLISGLSFLYLIDPTSSVFLSGAYRHTGENDYGYRYGSASLANLAYEHKLGSRFDGILELNFRYARKDRVDSAGTLDDDTGGALLYVTPRVLANVGRGLVLRAAALIPTLRDLNGYQTEHAVVDVGLTYLLPR